jgi:hypothetical protein
VGGSLSRLVTGKSAYLSNLSPADVKRDFEKLHLNLPKKPDLAGTTSPSRSALLHALGNQSLRVTIRTCGFGNEKLLGMISQWISVFNASASPMR